VIKLQCPNVSNQFVFSEWTLGITDGIQSSQKQQLNKSTNFWMFLIIKICGVYGKENGSGYPKN
jgi:hypothetical protein